MSAGCIEWRINGVGADRLGVQMRGTLWRPPIAVRRHPVGIPGAHGELSAGLPVFDAPTLPLEVRHLGSTVEQLDAAASAMVALVSQPTLVLSRVVTSPDGVESVTSAPADLVSVAWGDFFFSAIAKATILLAIPGVFLRAPASNSGSVPLSAASQTVEVASLAGSSGAITQGVVRVRGPLTSLSLTCPRSGTGLSWAGSLTSTQHLYLDIATLRAWKTTSESLWAPGGTDESARVDYPPAGQLQVWPRVTADSTVVELLVAVAGQSAETTAMVVRAGRSFL